MSLALRKVNANAAKSGCTLLFINQLRYKVRHHTLWGGVG
jgi:RecA/RadA recombinase